MALDLADPGFDHSVLCEFRARLLDHEVGERLLAFVLDAAREAGFLKARGRQRTDSTHVLAAIRDLNRIELLAETHVAQVGTDGFRLMRRSPPLSETWRGICAQRHKPMFSKAK